jgi:hypothetical protein
MLIITREIRHGCYVHQYLTVDYMLTVFIALAILDLEYPPAILVMACYLLLGPVYK